MNLAKQAFASSVACALLIASTANATDIIKAYAPPNAFGEEYSLRAHLSSRNYKIKIKVDGNTQVVGKVKFFNQDGKEETKDFTGSCDFTTGNFAAEPKVSFKAIPTGTALTVYVN